MRALFVTTLKQSIMWLIVDGVLCQPLHVQTVFILFFIFPGLHFVETSEFPP